MLGEHLHLSHEHASEIAKQVKIGTLLHLEAKNFVAGFAQMGFRMHRESERDRRGNKLGDLVANLVIE